MEERLENGAPERSVFQFGTWSAPNRNAGFVQQVASALSRRESCALGVGTPIALRSVKEDDMRISLQEDFHTHSTFSDGKDDLETNVAAAVRQGITRLGCVEHVRRDTKWLPSFVAEVRRCSKSDRIELLACVETKLLNAAGELDLPNALSGVDRVFVADHQFPLPGRCAAPNEVKQLLREGRYSEQDLIDCLVNATITSMSRYPNLVLAHLFSILPKVGLTEAQVTKENLIRIAAAARRHDVWVEVDERWRCPSERTVVTLARAGVRIVASTDSHMAKRIGHYDYVAQVANTLEYVSFQ